MRLRIEQDWVLSAPHEDGAPLHDSFSVLAFYARELDRMVGECRGQLERQMTENLEREGRTRRATI